MRILHIDTGKEMRGGQHQVLILMKALRQSGHDSTLLAPLASPLWLAASEAGFRTEPVHTSATRKHSKAAELVHAHDAHAHTIAAMASRRPFVVSRRVAFPVRRSIASRWKYWRARRFLAVSRFVANELKTAGVPEQKIDVVYDAVPDDLPAASWSPEYPAIALASDDPEKGRDLVQQAGKISGIEVLFSANLVKDLQRASMFVYISRSEGLGSAALLAMSMGVPVIASSVGGLTEVFDDGVSGLFVKNEIPDIIRAMRKVLSRPAFAQGLVEAGKSRVAERFTMEHLLTGTLACYRRALGSG